MEVASLTSSTGTLNAGEIQVIRLGHPADGRLLATDAAEGAVDEST